MSTDNRTIINDCEANTGWAGDDTATANSDTGQHYQGSNSLSTQLSNADEHMYTTQDSVGASTFSLNWSDSTLYMLIKDNLGESFANGGIQFVVGDGTNRAGYDIAGYDARGMPLQFFYSAFKLDVSVIVATPGSFATYAGSEASLNQAAATQIGYGSLHLAKAVGSVDNVFMDCFRYISNGSYALTINGGTSGTPETMADVAGDDISNGWGMVANPLASQYIFFAPTEWGESAAAADHYFTASNEQWFWMGDNAGGHAVGSGNFSFRVTGNATDTGSFVIDGVVIVNTGTPSDFDCSNSDIDTLEIDGCTMVGLASFASPVSGGTSRFCTNTIFSGCGPITAGGAVMTGCSISGYEGATDSSAMIWNIATSPSAILGDCTFTKGTAATHAIEFGTSAPTTFTISDVTFSGYNASDGQNDSTLYFADRGSDTTWNVTIDGGTTPSYKKERAGDTVNIITGSVTVTLTGLVAGSEVRVYDSGDDSVIDGTESSGTSFAFSDTAANTVYIRIFHPQYLPADITGFVIPASNTSIPVQQIFDRNYNNPSAPAAAAFVQGADTGGANSGSGAIMSVSFSSVVGEDNLVVGIISFDDSSGSVSKIYDDKSNSYTLVDFEATSGDQRTQSFYADNITNGPKTITVEFTAAVAWRRLTINEFAGYDTLEANASQEQLSVGTGTDAISSGSDTTTSNGCLIIGMTSNPNVATVTVNAGTNFTMVQSHTDSAGENFSEFLIQGTAGSVAATFTAATGSDDWHTFMLAFAPQA